MSKVKLSNRTSILAEIVAERQKQDAKWGEQNHNPIEWSAILTEECGEVAKEALRLAAQKLPVQTKFVVARDYDNA